MAAQAEPGEVLVSSTVKDLVAGSGIEFEERGEHELKGVPGEWRLYAVARRLRRATRKSGDVNIAYQVVGDGPFDLVWVPGWISNVEASWEVPEYAHFLDRLASFSRLILFDKRGTGLSDPVAVDRLPTLEQRMDDVRAVLDAAGSERAALFGASEGGQSERPLRCDISGSRSGARPARSIRQTGMEPGLPLGTHCARTESVRIAEHRAHLGDA